MVFTVVMPVVLLLLFNAIFSGSTTIPGVGRVGLELLHARHRRLLDHAVGLQRPADLGGHRPRAGIIKRFRGTPMPAWIYLAALVLQSIVMVAVTVAVLVGMGVAFYHLRLDAQSLVGLVVYTLIGTATMCAIGLALTRVATTADSASAIGPFSTVSLAFVSGVFIPCRSCRPGCRDIGRLFPLAHLANGLQSAFIDQHSTGLSLEDVGVLAIWGVVAAVVAVRTFRWEPQGR